MRKSTHRAHFSLVLGPLVIPTCFLLFAYYHSATDRPAAGVTSAWSVRARSAHLFKPSRLVLWHNVLSRKIPSYLRDIPSHLRIAVSSLFLLVYVSTQPIVVRTAHLVGPFFLQIIAFQRNDVRYRLRFHTWGTFIRNITVSAQLETSAILSQKLNDEDRHRPGKQKRWMVHELCTQLAVMIADRSSRHTTTKSRAQYGGGSPAWAPNLL